MVIHCLQGKEMNIERSQQANDGLVDARFSGLLIDGYFATCAKAGERPTYGYPANHLPEVAGEMEIRTSFLA